MASAGRSRGVRSVFVSLPVVIALLLAASVSSDQPAERREGDWRARHATGELGCLQPNAAARKPPARPARREAVGRNKRARAPDRVRAREAPRDAAQNSAAEVKAAPRASPEW